MMRQFGLYRPTCRRPAYVYRTLPVLTKLERLQMKRLTYVTELDSRDRSRAVDVIHEARHSTYQYRVDAT